MQDRTVDISWLTEESPVELEVPSHSALTGARSKKDSINSPEKIKTVLVSP